MKLNPNIFDDLQKLNEMHKLRIYENLKLLNKVNPIQLLEKESIVQPIVDKRLERVEKSFEDLESRKGGNEFLLEALRNRIPYFLPFQREKGEI